MPSWFSTFARAVVSAAFWFDRWAIGAIKSWFNWADSSIHALAELIYETYIIQTYNFANFTYYVGSFSGAVNDWVVWLAYFRIPQFYRAAVTYAAQIVKTEHDYQDRQRAILRRFLLDTIVRVALALAKQIQDVKSYEDAQRQRLRVFLLGYIAYVTQQLTIYINRVKAYEDAQRNKLRAMLLAMIAALTKVVNAIIPAVNSAAASGYDSTLPAQGGILATLIKDLASDNPVVQGIVGDLATIVLDVASVDDPLARIAAGKLLTVIINQLGTDKLAGGFANSIVGAFLGSGQPHNLHDVMVSIGNRLNACDAQWQQFYADGGDDLENLGRQMRASATPLFLAPLVAYFIGAVTDPTGTAAVTDATLTPVAQATIAPLIALLGG